MGKKSKSEPEKATASEKAPSPRGVPARYRLASERDSLTHKFTIGEDKGYLTIGLYADGQPGEIFVRMDKQGSQVSGFIDSWAIAVSMLLQVGVPLADVISKFKGVNFDPSGLTKNPEIPFAKSPVDYVSRYLENRFLGNQDN